LRNIADGKETTEKQLAEILELLTSLDKFAEALRRKGGDFETYLEQRDARTHELPTHLVKVREGNNEIVHYFRTEEELRKFSEENPDLKIFGAAEGDTSLLEKDREKKPTVVRRARHEELYESKAVTDLLKKIENKGLNVEHYSAQDKPLFEMIEGEGEKAVTKPLFSIAEILTSVMNAGRKGIQIKRFKGLGEMNAKELFETTMNPERRKLLRIDLTNAVDAEEMFTKLMGDEVEPRRRFIEDNALNVRNLDI
jgi:DNA gyrase subunit B